MLGIGFNDGRSKRIELLRIVVVWFALLNCYMGVFKPRSWCALKSGRQESKTADVAKCQAMWSLEPEPIDR